LLYTLYTTKRPRADKKGKGLDSQPASPTKKSESGRVISDQLAFPLLHHHHLERGLEEKDAITDIRKKQAQKSRFSDLM
jgi:hypothetical protein